MALPTVQEKSVFYPDPLPVKLLSLEVHTEDWRGLVQVTDLDGYLLDHDGKRNLTGGLPSKYSKKSSALANQFGQRRIGNITTSIPSDKDWVLGSTITADSQREARSGYMGWSILRRDEGSTVRFAFLDKSNLLRLYGVLKYGSPLESFLFWHKHFTSQLEEGKGRKSDETSTNPSNAQSLLSYKWDQWVTWVDKAREEQIAKIELEITYGAGGKKKEGKVITTFPPCALLTYTQDVAKSDFPPKIWDEAFKLSWKK